MATNQTCKRRGPVPTHFLKQTAAICMIIAAAGCSPNEAPMSDVKHNLGEPVRSKRASQFAKVTPDIYANVMGPLVGVEPSTILPESHPLSVRLQYWLDAVDATMRAAHPEELANVPAPFVQVVKDSSANAFVAPVPICYSAPLKIEGVRQGGGRVVNRVYVDLGIGSLTEFPDDLQCLPAPDNKEELREILADADGKLGDCRLTLDRSDQVVASEDCKIESDLEGVSGADSVVLMKTANVVSVFTGIVPLMTEEAMVAALVHELGHYYRSHPTVPESDYGYFYRLSEKQPARRPEPDPSLRPLGDAAVKSSDSLSSSEVMTRLKGQRLRTELYFAAGSVVRNLCRYDRCPSTCQSAYDYMYSQEYDEAMGFFPFSSESKVKPEAYQAFEDQALACFEDVSLASKFRETERLSVGWDVVSNYVKTPTWPAWLGGLPGSVRRAVAKLNTANSDRLAQNPPKAANLAEAFLTASQFLDQEDKAHEVILTKAQKEGLGQYTVEQEADEFSAEWVVNSGLDPAATVEAMRSLGKGSETSMRGFILGEEDCERLWRNKWNPGTDGYYFVPVGDYSEIHHSTCYRMFNLEREIDAHEYKVPATKYKTLSVSEWSKLKQDAASLSASGENLSSLFTSAMMTKFRSAYNRSCSYLSELH